MACIVTFSSIEHLNWDQASQLSVLLFVAHVQSIKINVKHSCSSCEIFRQVISKQCQSVIFNVISLRGRVTTVTSYSSQIQMTSKQVWEKQNVNYARVSMCLQFPALLGCCCVCVCQSRTTWEQCDELVMHADNKLILCCATLSLKADVAHSDVCGAGSLHYIKMISNSNAKGQTMSLVHGCANVMIISCICFFLPAWCESYTICATIWSRSNVLLNEKKNNGLL